MTASIVTCDLCGSADHLTLFDRGRNDEPVTNVVCRNCGLVFISPRPSHSEVDERYASGEFSVAARGALLPTPEKFAQSERTALRRFRLLAATVDLPANAGSHCLEVGCGLGSFLRLMRGAGWSVSGLEPDRSYAEAGTATYQLPIAAETLSESDLALDSVKLIAAFHVLEHVYSPRAFLTRAHDLLQLDGVLYLELPCIDRPYGGQLERFFWSAHLTTFSRKTLSGLLRLCGFAVITTGFVGDFLWIMARKVVEKPALASYPLDDPTKVRQKILAAHRRYKLFRKARLDGLSPVRAQASSLMARDVDIRDELASGAVRKGRRWLVEGSTGAQVGRQLAHVRGRYLAHFGMHVPGNAGDTLLFESVRKALTHGQSRLPWLLEPLWPEVTEATVSRLNREARGIVIGGGGLLLRDTNLNSNSGWQWNISGDRLRELSAPIVVYAIGYNRFRNQADFDAVFEENIAILVEKSRFFGLRNRGSIAALSSHLPSALTDRLRFQPCPTTVLRYLYPDLAKGPMDQSARRLALNVAFDRQAHRFGAREDDILSSIARAVKRVNEDGWQIDLVTHRADDANVIPWLIRERITFREIHLEGRPPNRILDYYQRVPLTVGMRGHSQMIPFGLGNGIVSLISHDKLAYFLADIGHPEWGVDVVEPDLEERLCHLVAEFDGGRRRIRAEIAEAQRALWQITQENAGLIARIWSQ